MTFSAILSILTVVEKKRTACHAPYRLSAIGVDTPTRKEGVVNRYFIAIFSVLLLIMVGSFISVQFYLGFHADAVENRKETELFEYYYNDTSNTEEPAMSNTDASTSTSSAITPETLTEIRKAQKAEIASQKSSKHALSTPKEPDTTLGSYQQLINRDYELPSDYRPDDLTEPDVRFSFYGSNDKRKLRKKAANALEELFSAAEEDGCILYGVSGFRSYERQSEIYNRNLWQKGSYHTNLYSAKPGTSEHQSGLAIDISCKSAGMQLYESFATTEEGKWISKNSWKWGFILRYPKEKTEITGYAYEPWHIRYVGKKLAKYLYENDLCLEEYYGYESSKEN